MSTVDNSPDEAYVRYVECKIKLAQPSSAQLNFINSAPTPNMKRPTIKSLQAELDHLYTDYDLLKQKYGEQCRMFEQSVRTNRDSGRHNKYLQDEIRNLRQQLTGTARAAAELAHTVEHIHNHEPN